MKELTSSSASNPVWTALEVHKLDVRNKIVLARKGIAEMTWQISQDV